MQAAANRSARPQKSREADNSSVKKPHMAIADDAGLLGALPIAAAIIERQDDSALRVSSYNSRFGEMVEQSSCTAID